MGWDGQVQAGDVLKLCNAMIDQVGGWTRTSACTCTCLTVLVRSGRAPAGALQLLLLLPMGRPLCQGCPAVHTSLSYLSVYAYKDGAGRGGAHGPCSHDTAYGMKHQAQEGRGGEEASSSNY